ncbi:DUF4244 domain-containing protein [Streptomyces tritici]|uniref:DUF4244 domain-containing protein n=1 Tax=Streptomyces tritici TaxID=2054410 RepID=UPI003AF0AF50
MYARDWKWSIRKWSKRRLEALRRRQDRGMTTAEYAMGTIATAMFGTVLYKIVTSGPVSKALEAVIGKALDAQF